MTIDAIVDERALREIYLTGFEIAVREAQPWTVMGAYNKVNGAYACENSYLVSVILKEEWGHEGLVVTDWGAMNDPVAALRAGVDLEMPGVPNGNDLQIIEAVKSGVLDEAILDTAVKRILRLILKAAGDGNDDSTVDWQAHHALARRVAGEGAVLLKNDGPLLPLPREATIALVGRFARHPRYQGAGSSLINPTRLDNLYDELVAVVGADRLTCMPGYSAKGDSVDEPLIEEALEAARGADVVVICAGLTDLHEVEGVDRLHLKLPAGHDALITRLAAVHDRVVVVLSNGAPVEMPWVNSVSAIVEGYLGGQAGAGALADILTGKVNPSGKLAETFPLCAEDCPARPFPGGPATVEYRESIYIGYRYYDTVKQEVLFPFGHGLSYTSFTYRDLALCREDAGVQVVFRVKNSGPYGGKEVCQVYVRDLASTPFRPEKELKGFSKVELAPGEEKTVTIELDRRAFAFYDVGRADWFVEAGEFEIMVGASSCDIRLKDKIHLDGDEGEPTPAGRNELAAYYTPSVTTSFGREAFEALLGRPLPPNRQLKKGQFTLNTPLCALSDSFAGRQFIKLVDNQAGKMFRGKEETSTAVMLKAMINQMPLRGLLMQGGPLTRPLLEALLLIFNGKTFRGVKAVIKAVRKSG